MSDILVKKYKELEKYSEQQFHQIHQLQQQIKALQDENTHLKECLANAVPIIKDEAKGLSEEEAIAEREIAKLSKLSQEDKPLTLDEIRKLTDLVKIIQNRRSKKESPAKTAKTDDLLETLKELEASVTNG